MTAYDSTLCGMEFERSERAGVSPTVCILCVVVFET
jgi:hypothetical protein